MDGWMDTSPSTCAPIMLEHFQAVRDCGSRRLLTEWTRKLAWNGARVWKKK